jgi:mannosyltransferase OCH1-like enzyme
MGDSNGKLLEPPIQGLEIVECSKPPISATLSELKLLKNKPTNMKYSWETKTITPEFIVEESKKSIVKIVHQSYKSRVLSTQFKRYNDIWKRTHTDYTHLLWTDDDNRLLVYKHYPWFLPAYDLMPRKIMRIDIVRCLYLHKFGGIYADLDVFPTKSNTPLLEIGEDKKVVLGSLSDDQDWEHNIPNAWMYSRPGSDF